MQTQTDTCRKDPPIHGSLLPCVRKGISILYHGLQGYGHIDDAQLFDGVFVISPTIKKKKETLKRMGRYMVGASKLLRGGLMALGAVPSCHTELCRFPR